MGSDRSILRAEFERAAPVFTERTKGRFDDLDVVAFSRVPASATVAEVGVGTGAFLSLFEGVAGGLVGVDLTPAMLGQARAEHPGMLLVLADGARLPFASQSVDLVCSAQTLHHVAHPVPVLEEMRRLVAPGGRVLIVDQVATDRFEEAVAMNELEALRDPSHAASRPPTAFRVILQAARLRMVDERIVEGEQRLSRWMWPGEFPAERIQAVRAFIEKRRAETGMGFERDGDDWVFRRRRMMLLAEPA